MKLIDFNKLPDRRILINVEDDAGKGWLRIPHSPYWYKARMDGYDARVEIKHGDDIDFYSE